MMPDYIVLSPVGDHRAKHLDEFISAAWAFDPPPKEVVLCLDVDTELDVNALRAQGVTVKFSPEIGSHRSTLARICSAREILRKHFIYGKYELAQWIDSDIIAPKKLPKTLYDVMEDEQCWLIVNKYQGRGEGEMWCGSGVMLTHRHTCTASRFWVGNIYTEDGTEKHLSEDFVFFAIFDQGKWPMNIWTGRSGRVCDEYVKVKHMLER